MASGLRAPIILLVSPQLPENMGAIARMMKNFGLTELRVINPHCDLLDPKAVAVAKGADDILKKAALFSTLGEAIVDLESLWGTCAVERYGIKPYLTPRRAIVQWRRYEKVGLLFGPERTGLTNELITRCRAVIQIPTQPDFSSLNIAQSLAILAYEWFQQRPLPQERLQMGKTELATEAYRDQFLGQLEHALDEANYWRQPHKKPMMWQTLQNIFTRLDLTTQEIQSLLGMMISLRR